MTLARRFHPEAGREPDEAADWYEDQQVGLGDDFVELVEEATSLILEWPRIVPVFPGWDREPVVRTQAVSRFPHRVLHYFTDRDMVILAVAHNRRKPGYWTPRIGTEPRRMPQDITPDTRGRTAKIKDTPPQCTLRLCGVADCCRRSRRCRIDTR